MYVYILQQTETLLNRKYSNKMLTKEDVDSWNQLFPDCQINKTNLSNPSEHFLAKALVVYLRRFGYNMEPPFNLNAENKENSRETRVFLLKLARQIDHFLKITDKSYSFTYYDLIRPTPKKTAHMLYILLNYYYYYNLYKEEVFKMAGDGIRKLEELKGLIDDTRRDNEQRKEGNKNMKSTIENLIDDVAVARSKLKELYEKLYRQEEEFQDINHSYQDFKEKLKHLEEKKKLLRKRWVPEEEFQELQNQLQQLYLELMEHKEMELTNSANLNECKESNAKLEKLSKDVEKAHDIMPLHLIKQVQETKKQLTRVQKEEHALLQKEDIMLQEIRDESLTKLNLEQEHQNRKQEFETKQNELMKELNSHQIILKQKDTALLQLQEEDHISDCELEEQKDIAQYLLENLSEILSVYDD